MNIEKLKIALLALTTLCCAQRAGAGPVPLKHPDPADVLKTNFAVKKISESVFALGDVRLDSKKRSIAFPASVNMTNGVVEYLLVSSHGKLHESVLKTDVEPTQLHSAKLLLDPKKYTPQPLIAATDSSPTNVAGKLSGEVVRISLSWTNGSVEKSCSAEDLIFNAGTKSPMSRGDWIYTGSRFVEGTFMAQRERSIISLISDPDALIENPRRGRDNDDIWRVSSTNTPPLNTPVCVTLQFSK